MDTILEIPVVGALEVDAGRRGALPQKMEKPWGHELLWARGAGYAAKILHVEAGRRLSLQYHRVKEETMLVLRGRVLFDLDGDDGELERHEAGPGCIVHIPPSRRHRLTAVETSDILEVSTPELEDLVRLEDDFGRL